MLSLQRTNGITGLARTDINISCATITNWCVFHITTRRKERSTGQDRTLGGDFSMEFCYYDTTCDTAFLASFMDGKKGHFAIP